MVAMILATFWTRSMTDLTRTTATAQERVLKALHSNKMSTVSTLMAHRLAPAIIFRRALNNPVGLLTHTICTDLAAVAEALEDDAFGN